MPVAKKVEAVAELKAILKEKGDFVLTTYSGLNIEQLSGLRLKIRERNARLKIVKNNLFAIALRDSETHKELAEQVSVELKGPIAVAFTDEDFSGLSKLLTDFSKEVDLVQVKGGCYDGQFLKKNEVVQIASLPSREEMLAIIARGINTPAQKIAFGMNEIITRLARAIQEVGKKNG